jgi:hypothetical protein
MEAFAVTCPMREIPHESGSTAQLPAAHSIWRAKAAWVVSRAYLGAMTLALPLMPLLAGLVFLRLRYVVNYSDTFKKCVAHVRALAEGPANHYFRDVAGLVKEVPTEIHGSCVQCGNCCMNHRCMFLEPAGDGKFNCGIYDSVWRNFSNCGSFPINRTDIERYQCPSYFVAGEAPIRFMARLPP